MSKDYLSIMLDGDNTQLANLCGPLDQNLKQIAQAWDVIIQRQGNKISVHGNNARQALNAVDIFHRRARHLDLTIDDIQLGLVELQAKNTPAAKNEVDPFSQSLLENPELDDHSSPINLRTKRNIRPRTARQRLYLEQILNHDITFGVGPAGTGKTWLAVACAIDALESESVQRIILTRPAVEAGERLGFLPGDLSQKVDPYLRPLYDALYELMGFDKVQKLFERQTIEVAPLAYMRGRTLNHAFIILDEGQNTTIEQMKMFLTRIGFGSKAVITGDPTQVDLPKGQISGLIHAAQTLAQVNGIGFSKFNSKDVVRHPLVAKIIDAYEQNPQT